MHPHLKRALRITGIIFASLFGIFILIAIFLSVDANMFKKPIEKALKGAPHAGPKHLKYPNR